MPGVATAITDAHRSEKSIATVKIWLAIFRAISGLPAPMYWLIITAPATVTPLPKLMTVLCTGLTRLMAAR